jgi:hypothetical protein
VTRRLRIRLVAVGVAVLVGAGAAVFVLNPDDHDDEPPVPLPLVERGLLPWAPRGSLASDQDLVDAAVAVWRRGTPRSDIYDSPALASVRPSEDVFLLWAGRIGAGRVVVLQSMDTDGEPSVAQVAEHGDPAELTLDLVAHLPADAPPVVALTYDGNLNMPSMAPGVGAALIELLTAPSDQLPLSGIWQQRLADQGGELRLLTESDDGVTGAFLQLGDPATARTPLLLARTTAGRAGIARTIAVHGGEMVPTDSQIALRDVPPWGPSGRIQGTEYADAMIAAASIEATTPSFTAAVIADASGTLPDGTTVSVRLLAVLGAGDHPVRTVVVARDEQGAVLCSSVSGVSTTAGDASTGFASAVPADGVTVLAGRCASATDWFVATIAAVPGNLGSAGSVRIDGADPTVESGGGTETSVVMRLDPYAGDPGTPGDPGDPSDPGDPGETTLVRRIGEDGLPVAGPGTAVLLPPVR